MANKTKPAKSAKKVAVKKIVRKGRKVKRIRGYLIIERIEGDTYAYIERPSHHKKMMRHRHPGLRRPISDLDTECDLSTYGKNVYFIQELR